MSLDLIRSALATKGGEHLGDVLWWTLTDARIERSTLESLWAEAGLDAALLPDAPTVERALRVAVREAAVGQGDRLIRLAKEDASEITFAVIREQRPGDGSLDYYQEARIQLDRQREAFTTDRPGHDLVVAVRSRFDTYRATHHPDDVRRAIAKVLDATAAVALRPSGGIHWVPSAFAGTIRKLQAAIERIGASRMYLLEVTKSTEAVRTLGEIAKGSIEAELAALQTEIESFLSTPPERASTLIRRFDALQALRSRAKLYREVLAVEVRGLDEQLAQMGNAVETLLNAKAA